MIKINLFFTFFFTFFVLAQEETLSKDFQSWNNIELKYRVVKNLELILEGGFRLTDDLMTFSKYFSDFTIKRKHNNMLSYSLGYRYLLNKNNDLIFDKKHRLYADIRFKKLVYDRLIVSFRTRLQKQIDSEFGGSDNMKNKLREKLKFSYGFDNVNLDIFFGAETFYHLFDEFEKIRYIVGVDKSLDKKIDLCIDYIYQKELGDPLESFSVIRTTLSYKIQ